jgi:hypothetical protein
MRGDIEQLEEECNISYQSETDFSIPEMNIILAFKKETNVI